MHSKTPQFWNEIIQTRGKSDLYVQQNTWQPGGSTGWHTHPGPSFVIVTQGSVTVYEGDDATCTPHVYTADTSNNSFVDIGGGDVHLIRNETGAVAKTMAVQLVPAGATRRVDAAGSRPLLLLIDAPRRVERWRDDLGVARVVSLRDRDRWSSLRSRATGRVGFR